MLTCHIRRQGGNMDGQKRSDAVGKSRGIVYWNGREDYMRAGFSELLRRDAFSLCDIVLKSVDDGVCVAAHCCVLSAASTYFRELIENHMVHNNGVKPQNATFEGVTGDDLRDLLTIIYYGNVEMKREQIDRFLLVARDVRLNGVVESSPPPHKQDLSGDIMQMQSDDEQDAEKTADNVEVECDLNRGNASTKGTKAETAAAGLNDMDDFEQPSSSSFPDPVLIDLTDDEGKESIHGVDLVIAQEVEVNAAGNVQKSRMYEEFAPARGRNVNKPFEIMEIIGLSGPAAAPTKKKPKTITRPKNKSKDEGTRSQTADVGKEKTKNVFTGYVPKKTRLVPPKTIVKVTAPVNQRINNPPGGIQGNVSWIVKKAQREKNDDLPIPGVCSICCVPEKALRKCEKCNQLICNRYTCRQRPFFYRHVFGSRKEQTRCMICT